jgi:NAD(P)-dependent dehydrogenase (short-subunit alcohol dehydrogenase family)
MISQQLYLALPILRGLLAKHSGNEDDPWSRIILGSNLTLILNAARSALPPLQLNAWDATAAIETIRAQFSAAIEKFTVQHGAPPNRVKLADAGEFQIERYQAGDAKSKIALVTGAAGAIGAGICRKLLEYGYCVAATDLVKESLDDLVKELKSPTAGRIIGVRMDVTDKESVTEGFTEVVGHWGGVDIAVVNAGIAMVAPLMDMDPDAFRKLEKVNVEGTLLTLAEAGRCMCRQKTGGDIILISTKNVFAPGAQFGAYSATKAASHQLARIASLEYAPFDIRVNMVAPDAVFSEGKRQSGLWAEVGPSRMKARGLDAKGLEEYYRNRNLLKARVTAAHVANAVLFFATRQTPTTGATIPVDGGLPDATPR